VSSFIGFEQKKAILEKYDIPCYLKMPRLIKMLMDVDEDCSLNIFEMIESTNEPTKEFVNKELLIFKRFEVDIKNIKCPL
jgi:hypothetical protein